MIFSTIAIKSEEIIRFWQKSRLVFESEISAEKACTGKRYVRHEARRAANAGVLVNQFIIYSINELYE